MGKTRDLLNKTGDIKGTFHAKMGTMDRNGKDLAVAEAEKKSQIYRRTIQKRS